ncbi:MAG: pyrroloquinoline quinone biosynthesis protein B, partial [Burkholderiales bacterium PBB5]
LAQSEGWPQVGDSIALAVRDLATGQRAFCAPGLAQIGAMEFEWMREADCLLLDNLQAAEPAPDGPWLDLLRRMPARHKVLFGEAPSEAAHAEWAEQGIALAYDGMEIEL